MQLALDPTQNTETLFRELYYHLYSNSSSSRSERILADLSKLILVSILDNQGRIKKELEEFENLGRTANKVLLPALKREFPTSVNESEQFTLDDGSLLHSLTILRQIDLTTSPSHTFGDAFQALMGPRLRGDKGQFFTPRSVVRSLVEILEPKNGMRIIDPACGTGGFLSATIDYLRSKGESGKISGIDKDSDLSLLASALSSVHASNQRVQIHNCNSLDPEALKAAGVRSESFDIVVTNPPFGSKIGITEKSILKHYELGHVWEQSTGETPWARTQLVRPTQDPQVLFIELCVNLLKDGGKLGIVLPEGLFGNARSGYVWDYLRSKGQITALIDCPRTTFQPSTDTKTNILVFEKGQTSSAGGKVWVSVAYSCGHDKRGRSVTSSGQKVPDDFSQIAKDWQKTPKSRKLWTRPVVKDSYYLVPRYYDLKLADDVLRDAKTLNSSVTTIGELLDLGVLSIRKGHEVGSEAYGTGDIPFIRTSDIHSFEASYDPTNCVSEEIYEQYQRQQNLNSGDLLMVVDGRYRIGRCGILHEWNKKCVVQSHLKIISLSSSADFSPFALLYGLSLSSVQAEIRRLVFIQSTLGGLGQRVREIRLPDPRDSQRWNGRLKDFECAIVERAKHANFLKDFGNEVAL